MRISALQVLPGNSGDGDQSGGGRFGLIELDRLSDLADSVGLSLDDPKELVELQQIANIFMSALSPDATGVVLSSEHTFYALGEKAQNTGVVFSLNKRSSQSDPLSLPFLLDNWGIEQIKNNYALAKLELFYNPLEQMALQKKQLVAELYDYAHHQGIDFILDLNLYQLPKRESKPTPADEDQESLVDELFFQSVDELKKSCDLLVVPALESPLSTVTLTAELDIPWIISDRRQSSYDNFKDSLRMALEGGAAGFLAGKMLWTGIEKLAKSGRPSLVEIKNFGETTVSDRMIELVRIIQTGIK